MPLIEQDIYNQLLSYCANENNLMKSGYPLQDVRNPTRRMPPVCEDGQMMTLRETFLGGLTCGRCTKHYEVQENGHPIPGTGCWYYYGPSSNGKQKHASYSCHVHLGEDMLANYTGYVETSKHSGKLSVCALDCEMAFTTHGKELIQVTVVDHLGEVKYDEIVKPNHRVLDYNTKFSGIEKRDLYGIKTSLKKVQKDLLRLISSETIIVGHSLEHDMKALKMFHTRFIDTALLNRNKKGQKQSLKKVVLDRLGVNIQQENGHDSIEDARAALCVALTECLGSRALTLRGDDLEEIPREIISEIFM